MLYCLLSDHYNYSSYKNIFEHLESMIKIRRLKSTHVNHKYSGHYITMQLHRLAQFVCHCYRVLPQQGSHRWEVVHMNKPLVV